MKPHRTHRAYSVICCGVQFSLWRKAGGRTRLKTFSGLIISLFMLFSCDTKSEAIGKEVIQEPENPYQTQIDSLRILYPGNHLDEVKVYHFDVTGDGAAEEVIYHYTNRKNDFNVSFSIIDGQMKQEIFSDKLELTEEDFLITYYNSDSIYFSDKYYMGLIQLLEIDSSMSFENSPETFTDFENDPVVSFYFKKYGKEFQRYYRKYKGRYLTSVDILSSELMIWYEPERKFKVIYSP
ncbi:MAG: hypothetical protein ACO1O6_14640 [Bacteroidota bacterium]